MLAAQRIAGISVDGVREKPAKMSKKLTNVMIPSASLLVMG
jgi:hypothetical protein